MSVHYIVYGLNTEYVFMGSPEKKLFFAADGNNNVNLVEYQVLVFV